MVRHLLCDKESAACSTPVPFALKDLSFTRGIRPDERKRKTGACLSMG